MAVALTILFGALGTFACTPVAPQLMYSKSAGGRATVLWDSGASSCIADEYRVTLTDAVTGVVHSSIVTPDLSCTVNNLVKARKYNVKVQAYSYECNCGTESQTDITVQDVCDKIPPSRVVGLYAKAGVDQIEVCWQGPANYGCVTEYRIWMAPSGSAYEDASRWTQLISHGECVTFKNLAPATEYNAAVQAYSEMYRGGSMAWVHAKTKDSVDEQAQWVCKGLNTYPLCAAATLGLCEAMTCELQVKYGKCSEDWMRRIDWQNKTVTQYCALQCPCPTLEDIPIMKAPTSWLPVRPEAAATPAMAEDDSDLCCRTNSFSYSPTNRDICLSPFGNVVQVGVAVSKNGSSASVSASVSVSTNPGAVPQAEQCATGACPSTDSLPSTDSG